MSREKVLILAGVALLAVLLFSGIRPYDRLTWWMEVAPVLIAGPLLVATHRTYPLTSLLYVLIFAHAVVLIAGGTYTYARVPLGFWLQDLFAFDRNPYDKIGHFMQGFVPVMVVREILVRGRHVAGRRMTAFLSLCVALAVSACYELIEWWAALVMGQGADEFLGLQGDEWDTQSDMFMALLGAIAALAALSRPHDRQLSRLSKYNRK